MSDLLSGYLLQNSGLLSYILHIPLCLRILKCGHLNPFNFLNIVIPLYEAKINFKNQLNPFNRLSASQHRAHLRHSPIRSNDLLHSFFHYLVYNHLTLITDVLIIRSVIFLRYLIPYLRYFFFGHSLIFSLLSAFFAVNITLTFGFPMLFVNSTTLSLVNKVLNFL